MALKLKNGHIYVVQNVPRVNLFVAKLIKFHFEIDWTGKRYKVWEFEELKTGFKITVTNPEVRELTDEEKIEFL